MKLLRKKTEAAPERPGGGGRSLLRYFLPVVLVSILLILVVGFFAQQSMHGAARDTARTAAHSVASAVAARIEGAIFARRDLLALALADGRAAAALATGDADATRAVEADLQKVLPEVIQVRLLSRDANQPDSTGPAPLGYAGLDLLRRAVETGLMERYQF